MERPRARVGLHVWVQLLPDDGRFLAIGPLFVPGETACHHCYRLRRAASLGIGRLSDALSDVGARRFESCSSGAAAALAVENVLRWLGTGDPGIPGVLFALEWRSGLSLDAHLVLRVPRCPTCSVRRWSAAALPWFQPGPLRGMCVTAATLAPLVSPFVGIVRSVDERLVAPGDARVPV